MTSHAEQPPPRRPRMSRLTRVVLIVSLSLNLLVGALFASAYFTHDKWRHPRGHGGAMSGGGLAQALDSEDRHAIRRAMRAAHKGTGDPRAEMQAIFRDFAAVVRQDPYDGAAAAALLSRHRDGFQDRLAQGQSLLLERLAAMSPEARKAYADRLDRILTKRQQRRDGENRN